MYKKFRWLSLRGRRLLPKEAPVSEERCAAAEQALERGNVAEARSLLPSSDTMTGIEANARYAALQGKIAAASGDYDTAAACLSRAHQLEPQNSDYTIALAEAFSALGDMPAAATAFSEAIRQQPARHELLIDLAYVLLACGDRDGACEALDHLARVPDLSPAVIFALAQGYQALDQGSKAIPWLGQLSRRAPQPRGLNELARLSLHVHDFTRGELAFRMLGRADSNSQLMSLHGITWCHVQRSRWREALEAAVAAIRFDRSPLTVDFLTYVKDGLFIGNASDQLKTELGKRLLEEMDEYSARHCMDAIVPSGS